MIGGRVLVLAEGENPSLAYFVKPWLARAGATITLADTRESPRGIPGDVDAVVVVRYLPRAWEAVVAGFRRAGLPVAYFMDDDLMDMRAHAGLPLRYRWKIARLALWRRAAIERCCSEFRVSTPWLAARYAAWSPRLLEPRADAQTGPRGELHADTGEVRVCYHGTASHAAEQRWLRPVIAGLQSACENTRFTIIGGAAVQRLYRGIPRVDVVRPMGWPAYLEWTASQPADIALAPLVPGPFNAARAPTKVLDNARMGAVGLYADAVPYRGFVRDGVDGLLLPMQAEAWVAALQALAADPARRRALAAACRQRVQQESDA